jgi:hypothetical protein
VFFGVLVKLKAIAQGEFDDDSVNDQMTKLVQAYEQTATSMTIRPSFGKAGLVLDTSLRPLKLRLDAEEVQENARFKQRWDRNIKIEELSRRRQGQRFGMANSEFLID